MKFINKISDCLFYPSAVLKYRKDKFYIALLYFVFLSLLFILPDIIVASNSKYLDYQDEVMIRDAFSKSSEMPFYIEDGQLVKRAFEAKEFYVQTEAYKIFFTESDQLPETDITSYYIVFMKDSLNLVYANQKIEICKYNSDFDGIDFRNATINNHLFWSDLFQTINSSAVEFLNALNIILILYILVQGIIILLLIILLFTFINRYGKIAKTTFGQDFKIIMYYSTVFVIASLIGTLFSQGFFMFLGIIITGIYSRKINGGYYGL